MRIVSMIASATEIVCALGFENNLVARSHECDYPPSVTQRPCVTKPRFNVHASSSAIDTAVKDLLRDGLSIYEIDTATLESLEPDVIVTQAQCEVCAVSLREVERAVCAWLQRCPTLVSLMPNGLADVWADIERVGLALGAADRAGELIRSLQARMDALTSRLPPRRPRVACIEWVQPLMAAGNWVPELVERAGGENLFGTAGQHSPWMTAEALLAANPEITILMPCGYDLPRTQQEVPLLPEGLPGRVVCVDGNAYFNRPGPRLVESLEILAEILHPTAYDFGHAGQAWREVTRD
jgi:iron complex transport system substrate-binding protein